MAAGGTGLYCLNDLWYNFKMLLLCQTETLLKSVRLFHQVAFTFFVICFQISLSKHQHNHKYLTLGLFGQSLHLHPWTCHFSWKHCCVQETLVCLAYKGYDTNDKNALSLQNHNYNGVLRSSLVEKKDELKGDGGGGVKFMSFKLKIFECETHNMRKRKKNLKHLKICFSF